MIPELNFEASKFYLNDKLMKKLSSIPKVTDKEKNLKTLILKRI